MGKAFAQAEIRRLVSSFHQPTKYPGVPRRMAVDVPRISSLFNPVFLCLKVMVEGLAPQAKKQSLADP